MLSLVVAVGTTTAAPNQAPVLTNTEAESYLFTIPAPRGLIVDRTGEPLATNEVHEQASVRLSALQTKSVEEALLKISELHPELQIGLSEQVKAHWEHRRNLPYAINASWTAQPETQYFETEKIYRRSYPHGSSAAHLIGYISRETNHLSGPIHSREPLWPLVKGRAGIEEAFDGQLRGSDGLLSVIYREDGTKEQQVVTSPVPGSTVVLAMNLQMQQLAERLLAENGRAGAFVALDAATGDILAAASHPTFSPGEFVPSMSEAQYQALASDPKAPFFPRPWAGQYPPGSIFKPFSALGGMNAGVIRGLSTLCPCESSYEVAGRKFHNWSDKNEGWMDVRTALMRSCNTWFFQVAEKSGSLPILATASDFGLGAKPAFPLTGTSAGRLPSETGGAQAAANLSIGQGDLLVSPLQMALAMAGIANGGYVPKPRLILQIQNPPPQESVKMAFPVQRAVDLDYRSLDLRYVRQGMWGVVNRPNGTGTAARMDWPHVLGKTGTAQWSKDGEERSLVWFAGYVNSNAPQIAYVVMLEGESEESIFGGSTAAPVAGEFLRTVYADPDTYGIQIPSSGAYAWDGPFQDYNRTDFYSRPDLLRAQPIEGQRPELNRRPSSSGQSTNFLGRLFGRRGP